MVCLQNYNIISDQQYKRTNIHHLLLLLLCVYYLFVVDVFGQNSVSTTLTVVSVTYLVEVVTMYVFLIVLCKAVMLFDYFDVLHFLL